MAKDYFAQLERILNAQLPNIKIDDEQIKKSAEYQGNVEQEAKRLKEEIAKHIDAYYTWYSPKKYHRTQPIPNIRRALSIKFDKANSEWVIYFDADMVMHPSIFTTENGNGTPRYAKKRFVPTLIDEGWRWKSGVKQPNDMFTNYEGYHFIQKALNDYKASTKNPVQIDIKTAYHKSKYDKILKGFNRER